MLLRNNNELCLFHSRLTNQSTCLARSEAGTVDSANRVMRQDNIAVIGAIIDRKAS
jgi:hypothetical protein